MNKIHIKAPAKINFGLNITGKRLDGFHNLITLFYPLHDLHDELIISKSDYNIFEYDESIAELNDENLILQAKHLLEEFSGKSLNTEIILKKNIPIGAGLGGGSSDAAAALISLNELFELDIMYTDLAQLALQLGSDVPFFLRSKSSIGKSRGEILTQVEFFINYPILIVNPGIHVSTKSVFNLLKEYSSHTHLNIQNPRNYESIKEFNNTFTNDFESIVFELHPEVGEIKKTLVDIGAGFVSMTGTGSSVFGIFENQETANFAKDIFPSNYFTYVSLPKAELM